jgi:hypothetical protein
MFFLSPWPVGAFGEESIDLPGQGQEKLPGFLAAV